VALSAACALAGCNSTESFRTATNDMFTPTPGVTSGTVAVRSQPNPNFNINDNIATGVNQDVGLNGLDYDSRYGVSYNDRSGNDFVATDNNVSFYPQANNSNATSGYPNNSNLPQANGTIQSTNNSVAVGNSDLNRTDLNRTDVARTDTRTDVTRTDIDNRTVAIDPNARDMAQPNPATDRPGDTSQLKVGNQKTDINAMVAERDRNFVLDVASGGIYEVQAGEKAVAKGTNDTIKGLGQHMIDDHSKSNKELQALAERKGIHVSSLPDADKIAMLGKLDSLNGSDFDKEFLKQQQMAHQDTIAKFEAAANSAADKDIRDWAAGTLPKLREHLAMINTDLGVINTNIGSERP